MESLSQEELEQFTTTQLKEELRFRFLNVSGLKQDLVQRLLQDNQKKYEENILETYKEEKQKRMSQQWELEQVRERLESLRHDPGMLPSNATSEQSSITKILETQTMLMKEIINSRSTPTLQVFSTADTSQAIPLFNGKKYENAKEWVKQVERIAKLANWADNLCLINATMRLRSQAKDWHKAIGKNLESWTEWKLQFIERFSIKMTFAEFINYQNKRKLNPTETLTEYIYSKNALFEKSPTTIPEEDKVSLLLEGITDTRWSVPLATLCCTTVDQLINHASALDQIRKVSFNDKNKPQVTTTSDNSSKFIPRYNPQIHNEQEQTCYRCKQKGHVSYNCKNKTTTASTPNDTDTPRKPTLSTETNDKQNKKQVNCVQKETHNVTLIPVQLNDSINLEALPDSGSVLTIIDKNMLPQDTQVYPWQKGNYKVAGNDLIPLGWITAKIQVGKIDYVMPQIAICERLPVPMILGKDWQHAVYARIIHEPDGKICIITPTHTEYFPSVTITQNTVACCVSQNRNDTVPKIQEEDIQKIEKLVEEYQDIFTKDENDIGKFPDFELEIKLKHEKPISCKPYRLPEPERQFLKKTVEKWIEQQVCRLSKSPYAAPMFVVQQPFHETTPYRPVVDYSKTINPITILDVQPIERMDDIIHTISQFVYKFKLDIYHAYHNISIKEEDVYKTAVITQDYHIEFLRVMFGLIGGPAIMSKVVNSTYGPLYNEGIRVYFDDISGGADTVEKLIEILRKVFEVTRNKNLKLNKDKCIFIETEIPLFGRIIGYQQERTDPKRTIAVEQYETLQTITEVRSFLGFSGTFRKYIKNYASIARPLQKILKKDNTSLNDLNQNNNKNKKIELTEEQLQSFNELKKLITTAPILTNFQQGAETIVETDSSYQGLGACLLQIHNGEKKVIEYASRSLKDAETRYHINELEVTAAHWAIVHKFRIYLLGHQFTLITDSYSTAYIINKAKFNRKFARYVIDLAPFDFTPVHRPGSQNQIADHLSRYPLNEVCLMIISSNEEKLKLAQKKDQHIQQICKKLQQEPNTQHLKQINSSFKIENDILLHVNKECMQNQNKIVVPQSLRSSIMKIAHDEGGHLDFETTMNRVKSKYWWKTIRQDIKAYTKSCIVCAKVNRRTKLTYGEMGQRPIPETPMQVISSDHIVALPQTTAGNTYILVHIDHATRYIFAKPTCSLSAKDVIETIENDIIYMYGPPLTYISDGAPCFTSQVTQNFFQKYGIESITTTPYTPQSNGLVERANATIMSTLTKFALTHKEEWDKLLPKAVLAINTSRQKTIQKSPFYLLYGFEPRIPPNEINFGTIFEDIDRNHQLDYLTEARKQALINIDKKHQYNKQKFDLRRIQDTFEKDDYVLYEWHKPTDSKLTPRYKGPFKIIRKVGSVCYEIQDIEKPSTKKIVHVQFLKPLNTPHSLDFLSDSDDCYDKVQVDDDDQNRDKKDDQDQDKDTNITEPTDDETQYYTTSRGRTIRKPDYNKYY